MGAEWRYVRFSAAEISLSSDAKITDHSPLVRRSTLFAGLTQADCVEIAGYARARRFRRKELLFMQGQPVNDLILLESGAVKNTQLSSRGDEVLLRISGAGEILNLHTGWRLSRNDCSARAIERCNTLVWEYIRFETLLNRFPLIRQNMNRILADRLEELEERFREVASEGVASRLGLILLRLSKQIGKPTRDGVQISLNREELAQMIGTTLFTVSRVLSRWAQSSLVLPCRDGVCIVDPKRLNSAIATDGYTMFRNDRRRATVPPMLQQ